MIKNAVTTKKTERNLIKNLIISEQNQGFLLVAASISETYNACLESS